MTPLTAHTWPHHVVTHGELLAEGLSEEAIRHGNSARGHEGVRVHRTRTPFEIEVVNHIPVTTVPRTLLDLARTEADGPSRVPSSVR